MRFTLTGSDVRQVQLDIVDVTGRRVRRLMEQPLGGGNYRVSWDRADDSGRAVRPGVYHVRLRAGEERDSEGVILL